MQDRTEPASQRRRDETRKEGRVAKSTDLSSAVVLLTSLFILKAAGPYIMSNMSSLMRESLTQLNTNDIRIETLQAMAASYGLRFGMMCLPIAVGVAVVGFTANVLQIGFKVTPKAMAPSFSKLDPIKGFTRLWSTKSLVELLKNCIKIGVIAYFVYSFLRDEHPILMDLAGLSPVDMVTVMTDLCWRLMARGCAVMIVIGILDFIYQRFTFEMSIRMTKQEVKEEYKMLEGDPQIKGKIRQRQKEMARRRMYDDVAKADVVITNPTHFAVAIKYDGSEMSAPTVIAKGQRLMALKIKEIAKENGVPIVENPPVARLLYKTVEIGQQIPEELYQAVAEILAYVYQMSNKALSRA